MRDISSITAEVRRDECRQLADGHEEDKQEESGRGGRNGKPVLSPHHGVRHPLRNEYKAETDSDTGADERSRAFFGARVRAYEEIQREVVSGEREMMMVRMVAEGWENLSWISVGAANKARSSGMIDSMTPTATRKARRADLISSLMLTPSSSGPSRDATISPSPSRDHLLLSSPALNPFRRSRTSGLASQFANPKSDDLSHRTSEKRKQRIDGDASAGDTMRGLKMFEGAGF